jgi:hypothetical protein
MRTPFLRGESPIFRKAPTRWPRAMMLCPFPPRSEVRKQGASRIMSRTARTFIELQTKRLLEDKMRADFD